MAAGFEIARRTLGWYLTHMTSYSSVYGAFATVPIFLLWIYLGWVIVLLGAVIAAYAPSLKLNLVQHGRVPGQRFALALEIVRRLQRSREAGEHGLTGVELANSLRFDPLQIDSVLEALTALDWVGRLDEEGQPRYVLLCDPAHTPLAPLVDMLLLAPIDALAPARGKLGIATCDQCCRPDRGCAGARSGRVHHHHQRMHDGRAGIRDRVRHVDHVARRLVGLQRRHVRA